ncbi:MAG: DNA-directed RNA polymerase subunit K [Promethearchaeota archaeon]
MVQANILRKKIREAKKKIKIGNVFLTRYERARIIGARALQLSMNAPVLIPLKDVKKDPLEIAERELKEGVLPLTIRRSLASGDYQDIPLSWLIIDENLI